MVLVGRQPGVVELVDERERASQRHQHGASPSLGRVRREHQADGQAVDEGAHVCGVVFLQQLADGGFERTFLAAGGRAGTLAHTSHAMLLLGQVGEVEVQAEGFDERLDLLETELLKDGAEAQLPRLAAGLADVDGELADPLDQVKELVAGLLGDDLAQQRAQQLDLARQLITGAGRADTSWLGFDGGIGAIAARGCWGGGRVGHGRQRNASGMMVFESSQCGRLPDLG